VINTINRKVKSEAGFSVKAFDNKKQIIPDLILRPLVDKMPEDTDGDRCILETLEQGLVQGYISSFFLGID
jgi:hypothetical protein